MPFPKVAMYKFGLAFRLTKNVPLLKAQRPIQKPGARSGIWHFFLEEFGYALIGPNGLAQHKKTCRSPASNFAKQLLQDGRIYQL